VAPDPSYIIFSSAGRTAPDGQYLYFTSDRSFADKPLEAALSTREWNARLDGRGNGLGDTWRVPTAAVFEALGRTPRRATPYR
jgi:hypothetical protein